jgi:oxygen-independent coproporphyrinogen III oxidase
VPLSPYRSIFGTDPLIDFETPIERLISANLARIDDEWICLTPVGRLFVDSCSALFFSENEKGVPHPEEPEIRALERGVGAHGL